MLGGGLAPRNVIIGKKVNRAWRSTFRVSLLRYYPIIGETISESAKTRWSHKIETNSLFKYQCC